MSHFCSQLAAEAIPVTTKKLADVLFYPVRDAPSTTLSLNDTRVSTQLKGILKGINVRVGDSVKQGDVVASMDCEDYKIAVTQASAALTAQRATLKFDRSRLKKVTQLSKKNISTEEVERRTSNAAISAADVEGLKASLRATERAVDKCAIRAPFDAVVISKMANLGDYLIPGSPVLRLLDRDNVEVSAKVQEQDLELLKSAKGVAFIANDKRYPLVLRAILPLMESRIRSYEVRLEFTADKAYPGSAGRTEWLTPAPYIPAELLVRRKGLGIFLAVDGRANFIPLPGASAGQPAALAKSLTKNSAIIINGRFKINEGDAVRVIER
ncbi:MAG: efflux RND transporter periplasmic adaptor subunit [Gammaproteobacteria bacterium]|nr:efflux RND transporter periplasmic adaptor subunit [Gammaproteobacteria bacterium]